MYLAIHLVLFNPTPDSKQDLPVCIYIVLEAIPELAEGKAAACRGNVAHQEIQGRGNKSSCRAKMKHVDSLRL